jgi:hypothetical protein
VVRIPTPVHYPVRSCSPELCFSLQRLDTPATKIAPTILGAASAQPTHNPVTVFQTAQIPTRTGQTASILVRVLTRGRVRLGSPHPDLTVGRIRGFLWAFGIAPFFSWLVCGTSFLQVSLATIPTVHRPQHRTHYSCSLYTPLTASDNTVVFDIHPHFFEATNC